jgi:hypothetical protein
MVVLEGGRVHIYKCVCLTRHGNVVISDSFRVPPIPRATHKHIDIGIHGGRNPLLRAARTLGYSTQGWVRIRKCSETWHTHLQAEVTAPFQS